MFASLFDQFLGVPTHPLAVHAPVVLIPILAGVAIVVLFRANWREKATIPLAGFALVMVAMLLFAKKSGEQAKAAENVFGDIDRHEGLANQTFILAIVWLVLAMAAAVAVVVQRRNTPASLSAGAAEVDRGQIVLVLNVLASIVLIVTTIWLVRTGHAGSESRWKI